MTKRDCYNYALKRERKIVYHGMSVDPCSSRCQDHVRNGKDFTHIIVDTYPKTRKSCKMEETERIMRYERSHRRAKPEYNKIR
jgi:hypothetical protein